MSNIKSVSSYLIYIFNFILISIPLLLIMQWVLTDWLPFKELIKQGIFFNVISSPQGYVNIADVEFNAMTKFIGFISCVVDELPIFLGIFMLRQIFQNYKRGDIFSIENATSYNKIGWLFLLNGFITAPIAGMIMSVAVAFTKPIGSRIVSISFGTPNLADLFFGMLIIVISWVMVEGHKLQQDNQFTI